MNRKIIYALGIVSAGMISVVVIVCLAFYWGASNRFPEPVSDVPIDYKIGWWPATDTLQLTDFSVTTITRGFSATSRRVLVEYTLIGEISDREGRRPHIKSVHISERWESQGDGFRNVASIIVTPVLGFKQDDAYKGETLPFDISVQDYVQSGGWGENSYLVRSLDKEIELNIHHRK